ncbi:MAG: bifunctional oligoribonuclease/PAP phosphatase NrnA [Phycisphaerales bacterium]|nr:bifunctional oligoribonuclease/PAP phosphatase NrnA [Phycisphaerales bacterium]
MEPLYLYNKELQKIPKRIIITTHQKPDGDAMGSSLGLYHFLVALGHDVTVVSPTNWAKFLDFLPGIDKVIDFEKQVEEVKQLLQVADVLFCLDCNHFNRTKTLESVLSSSTCIKLLIDHHTEPNLESFNYGICTPGKSSTAEIVYEYIASSPWHHLLNQTIATCLYTGLLTDTQSFRLNTTKTSSHQMAAHLLALGTDPATIYNKLFNNFLETRLRFIGNALLNRLEVCYELNTAYMAIPFEDILKYEIKTGDTESLVNYLMTIEGIKFGALVIDRQEERKWSFRSTGNFNVSIFAREHFEGGGHVNAAGGRSKESLPIALRKFKEIIYQYKNQLV